MSEVATWSTVRERTAGKWQIPLLLVALALLAGAGYRLRPRELRLPPEQLVAEVQTLLDGGLYESAIEQARRLLKLDSPTDSQRAFLRLLEARALHQLADQCGGDRASFERVLEAYERAAAGEAELANDDFARRGRVLERLGRVRAAVEDYEHVLRVSERPELELRRRVIELCADQPDETPELADRRLGEFVDRAADQPDQLYWALERQNDAWLARGDAAAALGLIERLQPVFEDSDWRNAYACEQARVVYALGRNADAEGLLRTLRNQLAFSDPVYARSGWLLGQVVLFDDGPARPQEALSFFRDVLDLRPLEPYLSACRLGAAEALVELQRYDEALTEFQGVVAGWGAVGTVREPVVHPAADAAGPHGSAEAIDQAARVMPRLNAAHVRAALTIAAEGLRQQKESEAALRFADLAHDLIGSADDALAAGLLERTGNLRTAVARLRRSAAEARPLEEPLARDALLADARRLFGLAAEAYIELSRVTTLDESRSSRALWQAADLLEEGGFPLRTIALLEQFCTQRPEDPLVPQALWRAGQARQALGQYLEAISLYERNCRRSPNSPFALASLVPMATCRMALRGEHEAEADAILERVLNHTPVLTPQSPEFADALFLRGDLLCRRGEFERAIPLLEEALQRYPNDPRRMRAAFMAADAYRQSGLAIKYEQLERSAEFIGEAEQVRREQMARLARAAELFGKLVERYEGAAEERLDALQQVLLRHARLYQADCLYETQRYAEALTLYERAAWIYKDSPSSLAAYVQIINCNVSLGQPGEARAALRRAQYLVNSIPPQRFTADLSPETREDWERYFSWIEQSDLF